MLEDAVGETTIKAALTHYLSKHEFGNAVTNDLWSAISEKWDSMRAISRSRYTDFNFTVSIGVIDVHLMDKVVLLDLRT